jgi:hypothetical protein
MRQPARQPDEPSLAWPANSTAIGIATYRRRPPVAAGSQRVAEKLAADTNGRIFLEDAGFDWKVGCC